MVARLTLHILFAALILVSTVAHAEMQHCTNGVVTAESDDPKHIPLMCTASDRALAVLDACELQHPEPVTVTVGILGDQPCLGVFHCGENRIEIRAPKQIDAVRSETGVFQHLSTYRLFESLVVHEVAHAAFDVTPCPFDQCVATSEYFAYSVQLLALSAVERALIEEALKPVTRVMNDEINAFVLYMAPDVFVQKVWGHITAVQDKCLQLRQIQNGIMTFDGFHP